MSAQRMNRVIRMNRVTPMNRVVRMNRVLRSPSVNGPTPLDPETLAHIARVEADSGVVYSPSLTDELIVHAKDNDYYDDIALLVTPDTGILQNFIESVEHTQKAYDLGPDDNDVENTTAAQQPENVEGAEAGLPAGRRAWRFDGGQVLRREVANVIPPDAFTFVLVEKPSLDRGEEALTVTPSDGSTLVTGFRSITSAQRIVMNDGTFRTVSGTRTIGVYQLWVGMLHDGVLQLWKNGVSQGTSAAGNANHIRDVGLGGRFNSQPGFRFIGEIPFAAILSNSMTTEARQALESFLMQKYGITP